MFSIFFQSCEKEKIDSNDLITVPVNEKATVRADLYSQDYSATKFRLMMTSHFRNDVNRDPMYYLPEKIREEFSREYEKQFLELESLGRDVYLETNVEKGNISEYFANAIRAFDPILIKIDNGTYEKAIDDLIGQRPSAEVASNETIAIISLYDLIIGHIQDAINNEDQASVRTPCSLGDVIDGIVDGATIGAAVGAAIGQFIPDEGTGPLAVFVNGLQFSLSVYGAIVGGIVGAIGSFFGNDSCDCGPATSIRVVILDDTGDSCNPSYRLQAFGAGDDAELFNWNVNEGNSGAFYPSRPARLDVVLTQNSPDVLLEVSTTTLCADDIGDEEAMLGNVFSESPINLFDSFRQVEEVGDILIFGQFEQRSDGTIEFRNTGTAPIVRVSSTNGGTLRNNFTIDFLSGGYGSSTTGVDEFRLFVQSTIGATGSFRVQGTNNCSGAVSDLVFNYIIVQ